jgi:type VI secretion system protein ImpA
MALIDTENLLQPISEGEPSGSNLDYDPAFLAFERTAAGKPEQQMGETVVPGEPPDWRAVETQAVELLGRTKDLRVVGRLVQSLLHRYGFHGLFEGLSLLKQMLEKYWGPLHPQLDPEDNNDPTIRLTALGFLADSDFIAIVKAAPMVKSRSFGAISLREIAVASGEIPPSAGAPAIEMTAVEGAFQEVEIETLESAVQAIQSALGEVRAIEALFNQTLNVPCPDVAGLIKVLRQADQFASQRLASRKGVDAPADVDGAQVNGSGAPAVRMSGEILSRDDVVRTLDKICAYYTRSEPSSPLPILLQRCKRLATMSFIDIVREMAPEGLAHVEIIAGKQGDS